MKQKNKIGIVGAGAFGIALACSLSRSSNNDVILWGRDAEDLNNISKNGKSKKLDNITLPKRFSVTPNASDIGSCEFILITIPTQNIREACIHLSSISQSAIIISCAKGIENSTQKLPSEILEDFFPHNQVLTFSGPNFALELIQGLPAVSSLAGRDAASLEEAIGVFSGTNLRVYPNRDIVGTQIAGAVKNILAIACGICIGRNLGENARAAIITRGINEIGALSEALNGSRKTMLEPAGIGDISLTCHSMTSRNMSFGYLIGSQQQHKSYLEEKVVEGAHTVKSVMRLASKLNIEMPISQAVYEVIYEHKNINLTIEKLINRPLDKNI